MIEGKETIEDVVYRVHEEGFDYAMIDYSHWTGVEDPAFQQKLAAYKAARESLMAYVRSNDPKDRSIQ